MHKTKVRSEEKVRAVEAYLRGEGSTLSWAKRVGVSRQTFWTWVQVYQAHGAKGLLEKSQNQRYDSETMNAAVQAYLAGEGSQVEICKRFRILSKTQLQNWIKLYNGHKGLRPRGGYGGGIYMTKGRVTTYEERIEIVSFCIENDKNYAQAIEKYGVSYQQIYAWVRKYEEHGAEGLADKRGKRKDISEMTEVERLRAENRLLKAEIKQKELENAVLKKVEELERRGY